jgi:hypothetical protein
MRRSLNSLRRIAEEIAVDSADVALYAADRADDAIRLTTAVGSKALAAVRRQASWSHAVVVVAAAFLVMILLF